MEIRFLVYYFIGFVFKEKKVTFFLILKCINLFNSLEEHTLFN